MLPSGKDRSAQGIAPSGYGRIISLKGRLTDHRIAMNFPCSTVVEGNLEALIDALHAVDYEPG